MYVTLTLSRTDHIYSNLQVLSRLLHQRLGVFYDGLLIRRKPSAAWRSRIDIHTGDRRLQLGQDGQAQIAELVNQYVHDENVMFGYVANHVGGISYNFSSDYEKIKEGG